MTNRTCPICHGSLNGPSPDGDDGHWSWSPEFDAEAHHRCNELHEYAAGRLEMKHCAYTGCGKLFKPKPREPMPVSSRGSKMWPADQYCSDCTFWLPKAYEQSRMRSLETLQVRHRTTVVCNGCHYTIDRYSHSGEKSWLGFGGTEWYIEILDEAGNVENTIITNSLWAQGNVPKYLREAMPDNARIVELRERRRQEIESGQAVCF